MSLAGKVGTAIGTAAAYAVYYTRKGSTPIGLVTLAYAHRKEIQTFAVKHSINKSSPDAVQENLFKCLEYID